MTVAQVHKHTVTYNAAISACEKGRVWQSDMKEWQLAFELLRMMASFEEALDAVSYTSAINACARGQQWQLAPPFLQKLTEAYLVALLPGHMHRSRDAARSPMDGEAPSCAAWEA